MQVKVLMAGTQGTTRAAEGPGQVVRLAPPREENIAADQGKGQQIAYDYHVGDLVSGHEGGYKHYRRGIKFCGGLHSRPPL